MDRLNVQKLVSKIAEEEFQAKEQKMMPGIQARERLQRYGGDTEIREKSTPAHKDVERKRKLHFSQWKSENMETCFVFDMDGTLLDLEPLHFEAWREAVREHVKIALSDEFFDGMIGIPTIDCAKMICSHIKKKLNVSLNHEELMKLKAKIFFKVAKDARAFEGVSEALRKVKSKGFKIGFCTGSTREIADTMLLRCGISEYFPSYLRVTADDFRNGKPRPQPYQLAAKRTRSRPEQCIAFEDSPSGCKSASSAGYKYVLGILTSYDDEKLLRNSGATHIFNSTKDAVSWALTKFFAIPRDKRKEKKKRDVLVVCDFDWSLVNENSDTYILDVLDPSLREYMNMLRKEKPEMYGKGRWTALMNHCVGKLFDSGKTRLQIENALASIPYFKETMEAVKLAHASGAEILVLSDANTWYIESILNALKVRALFTEVISNRVKWNDKNATCCVLPYHDDGDAHACQECPPNLCKGYVMKNILSERTRGGVTIRPRVVYLGDGGGDFCPCSQLASGDLICARKDWRLHKKLCGCSCVNARIELWNDGKDVLRVFKEIFWRDCSY